jgi:prenyl protein peptidase
MLPLLLAAVLISAGYPLLLYVPPFRSSLPRDHLSTITRRSAACLLASVLAPLPALWLLQQQQQQLLTPQSAARLLGLAPPRPLLALVAPPALALLPYLPGLVLFRRGGSSSPFSLLRSGRSRAVLLRDLVIAPLAEEWCYRACLLPLLLAAAGAPSSSSASAAACWAAPLFFSLAHAHHHFAALLSARSSSDSKDKRATAAAAALLLQLSYTYAFGAFAAWLLLATGSLLGVAAAHALCNALGLPAVGGGIGNGVGAGKKKRAAAAAFLTVLATAGMVAGVVAAATREPGRARFGGGLLGIAG